MQPSDVQAVYVINLKRRPDRLRDFFQRIGAAGVDWPFPRPTVVEAIEGDVVGVPAEFSQGGGAYGCRMSHLRVLQDCLMRGVEPVLVLEDDADFRPGFGADCRTLLGQVPDDWQGVMLGGQHHRPPQNVADGIVRVTYAQRTHAYIARGEYLQGLQQRWGNCTVHIDWAMDAWQRDYRVYAPSPWLVGQAGGRSDIRGAVKPAEWWNQPTGAEPVIVLECPRPVMEELRRRGLHVGYDRNDEGIDKGLPAALDRQLGKAQQVSRLAAWIHTIQSECVPGSTVCTVWHPDADAGDVRAAWGGPVVEIAASSADEAIAQVPADWLSRSAEQSRPIVLLKCPPPVVAELRDRHGFHTGNWRDANDVDQGLVRLFRDHPDADGRRGGWQAWLDVLQAEADYLGRVVSVWHPQAEAAEIRQATGREVVVIEAESVDDAVRQYFSSDGQLRRFTASNGQ